MADDDKTFNDLLVELEQFIPGITQQVKQQEVKVWINPGSAIEAKTKRPLSGEVTLQNMNVSTQWYPEFRQLHMRMSTDDLIKLRDAISVFLVMHNG